MQTVCISCIIKLYVLYLPDSSCLKLNCDGELGPPTDPVKQEGEVFVLPGSVGLASCQCV